MPEEAELYSSLSHERRVLYRKACEAVEALPAKDARLLDRIEDVMGAAVKTWPNDPRTKMLSSRLSLSDRFSLYLFVVGNVCPPELFVDWTIQRKMYRYQESVKHMIDVVTAHMTGKLEAQSKTYYDLKSREVRTIITPSFASETDPSYMCRIDGKGQEIMPAGCEYWYNAIKKLQAHARTLEREPKSF